MYQNKPDGGDEKVSVTKLYLQGTIKIYTMTWLKQTYKIVWMKPWIITKNVAISDPNLRELLPPQVQLMSEKMRDLSGCEILILAASLQYSLHTFRLIHITSIEQLDYCRVQTN